MAEKKDLIMLVYDELKPAVERDPDCEPVIKSGGAMPLSDLFNMTQNPNLSLDAQKYLYAMIIIRAQELAPLSFNVASDIVRLFLKLCDLLPARPNNVFSNIKSFLTTEIMACENMNEIFDWGRLIIKLKHHEVNTDDIITILGIGYSSLIFDFPPKFSKESLIEYLYYLIKADIVGLDSTGALETIVESAINWVEDNNDFYGIEKAQGIPLNIDQKGTRTILSLLKILKIDEDSTNQRINRLKETYGFDYIDINYPDDDDYNLNLKSYKEGDEIKSINELILDRDPIVTHANIEKTIFTYIYRAKIKNSSIEVAVKKIVAHEEGINELEKFKLEADIMRALSGKHRSFLKFFGEFRNGKEYYMVMELGKRSLVDLLSSNERLSEIQMINIAKTLLEGFCVMSEKRIYHRDIKPQNILVTENLTPKIIDFGITLFNQDLNLRTTQITNTKFIQGTIGFMSPEQKRAYDTYRNYRNRPIEKYNLLKSDVYSLGITFYMMYTGEDVTKYEDPAFYSELERKIDLMSPGIMKQFISNMVQIDPNRRKTFAELFALVSDESFR